MSRYFPTPRPSRDRRNGGGRRSRPPKARPHVFTPSGVTDPWLGELCAEPCDQPRSAPVHRVPEASEEQREVEQRKVGERRDSGVA